MYHFTTDWFSHVIPTLRPLLQKHLVVDSPITALEIGSFQGRSTVWFLENILTHSASSITCIDTFEGSVEHTEREVLNLFDIFSNNIKSFKHKVKVLPGNSQIVLRQLPCTETFDFIYVDGDHRARYVIEDLVLVFPLLKRGGLLLIDDYEYKGRNGGENGVELPINLPKLAIDSFMDLYQNYIQIIHKGYQVLIRKKSNNMI